MIEKDLRWNAFIREICFRDMETLSEIQRNAVLCFWYDAEMNSGGHSAYMDCRPDTDPDELSQAICDVGNKEIAENYLNAAAAGANDDWAETDSAYYKFSPSLCDCLREYVEANKAAIFV